MKTLTSYIIVISVILSTSSQSPAKSPYRISWEKDGYILGSGIASSTVGYLLYHSVSPPTAAEVNQLTIASIGRLMSRLDASVLVLVVSVCEMPSM